MQCKGRYCREKKELPFPLKSGYFTEVRCQEFSAEDGPDPELCDKCQKKSEKPFRVACQQGQYQGKIDEPYFAGSWLFGSDRFLKYHTMPGNALPKEEYERAEAAQKIAQQDNPMPRTASGSSAPKSTAPKAASQKLVKSVVQPPPPPQKPIAVESLEEPLEVLEIVKVKLKPSEASGRSLWIGDGHIYERLEGGRIGKAVPDFSAASSEDD